MTLLFVALLILGLAGLTHWRASAREKVTETAHPPVGDFVTVSGRKVHFEIVGQGPDIVLIHGASGNLRDFTFSFADRLKDRYRVIMMDRPGLGWTDRAGRADDPPMAQAELLREAAKQLGVENPIVLGHSFGGAIALAWALQAPQDVSALVLVSAVSEPWPGDLGIFYRLNGTAFGAALTIPLITAFTPKAIVHQKIDETFAPQDAPAGYAAHIAPGLTLRRGTMRANTAQVNNLRPHIVEMSKRYETLTMPIELVHGTLDTTVPLEIHADVFAEGRPNAALTRLEGAGHMPHHTHPQPVVDAIDRAAQRAGLRSRG